MKKKLKFSIIYGSTRKKRVGIRFAKFLKNSIIESGNEAYIIDPLEKKFPMLDKRYEDYKKKKYQKILAMYKIF